ncbi:MAG: prolyl oligopeptidase family serine peptidase [Chitinophagaceae bacterium]|uniref:alpha/beta hydrolase family protein n=1 Tax=unclassified Paraflavitalea TaxID=2798305 RepID=UPI003D33B87A|nr:prolyl oligopeptidase family serine peptidase [Chitinophagaceae bacterium]
MRRILVSLSFCLALMSSKAQDAFSYQLPPKDIQDLVLAKPTPGVSIDSKGSLMLLSERSSFPSVEELAQPELRIGGLRLNPQNFSPSRTGYAVGLQLKNIKTGAISAIEGLPENLRAGSIQWSPDETKIAFTHSSGNRVDLYIIDVVTKKASKINKNALNTTIGGSFQWISNNALLYKVVPNNYRTYPPAPLAPKGPVVQENLGKAAASRTYQDLIKNGYDEDLFDYMTTSQLVINNLTEEQALGKPAIYQSVSLSPDKQYILATKILRPFSYLVPASGFPHSISVISASTGSEFVLVKNPSAEGQPIGFDDVVSFPRDFEWRADLPSTVVFTKALDKGMGRSKTEFHDELMQLPINGSPVSIDNASSLLKATRRLRNVIWGNGNLALVYQSMTYDRKQQIFAFNPSNGQLDLINERSSNDAYSDIGSPITSKNSFGKEVLMQTKNGNLLLRGAGSSPEGDMPFLQSFDLKTKKGTILWRCEAPYYETVVDVLDAENGVFITSKESPTETPNYYIRNLKKKVAPIAITDFKNPYPQMEGVAKQKISYKRADGIDLTGDLYLPKGYDAKKDGPLPVIMWAYPREYKSASDAAQVRGSKYTFTRINYGSPIFWITQGYAVLDNAEMPIVGEGNKEPNDAFIPQLYLNAHAAIQALSKMGVGDSNRVAVGGHSYGAFMTANLLAHTKLFKAGIARSGAYNRTLTPFGFQAEERTYWEAPDVYYNMSPFSFANKIKTPLLMIHGEMDNNSGTFPIQSERMYNAIKGHGGTTRLVFLPYESHGYAGKENILHMLWEQNQWLEKYVKNPPPAGTTGGDKKTF